MKTFKITQDHIKLLQNTHVLYDDNMLHQPYGGTDIIEDMIGILGLPKPDYDKGECIQGSEINALIDLHKETATALQIILYRTSFEIGEYENYPENSVCWRKVTLK